MTKRVLVSFSIGSYQDEILCDVVPMHASHLLLGRPCQYNRKVKHDGFQNRYSFFMEGTPITLVPLSPRQVYKDQVKIKKEARINCENESSKKVVERESDQKKVSEKNMSGKEKEGEEIKYKKICFTTNDINPFLPNVDVSSLQGFEEEFAKIIHNTMAKIRG